MDLMELEEITATVGGIADLLGALCTQSGGGSCKGLYMLFTQAFDAADKLEKLVSAAYAEARGRI